LITAILEENLTPAEADEINRKEIERFWSDYYDEEVLAPDWEGAFDHTLD
jgi:hypothetical protein